MPLVVNGVKLNLNMFDPNINNKIKSEDGWAGSSAFDDKKEELSIIEEMRKVLEKNNEMTEEILEISRKTKKYIFWGNVSGVLKILLVLAPIILAIVYLPPILKDAFKQIQALLSEY